jgi:hypothetical protein
MQRTIRTHAHAHTHTLIRTLRTRSSMTSPQQPPQPSCDPQDPATYQRLGIPVPRLLRVRELQAYNDWVEDGGLDKIALAADNEDDNEKAKIGEKLQGSEAERIDDENPY